MPTETVAHSPWTRLLWAGLVLLAAIALPDAVSQAAPRSVSPQADEAGPIAASALRARTRISSTSERRDPAEQVAFQDEVADLVDAARGEARSCGPQRFEAVRTLRRSAPLDNAAASFALDMGRNSFFDHVSPLGDDPDERARAVGYRGLVGENIAAGHRSPSVVVRAWLRSPDHCRTIMSASARDLGVGFARVDDSPYTTYWVLSVGTRD